MKKILMMAAMVMIVCLPRMANAVSFTDESAWRAAVSNVFAFENFDSIAAGTSITQLPALGIRFDPLNDGTQPTVQAYANTGGVVRSGPNNFLNDDDFALPGEGPLNMRPINNTDFLFGLGLWNVGGDDQLELNFFDANDSLIESVTSAISSGFFGIVNAAGAVRAEVNFVQGNGYAPVDDLQTAVRGTFIPGGPGPGGNNNAVPEPITTVLSMLSLGALGMATRRRVV